MRNKNDCKRDIHGQIVAGLKGAKFPINTPEELLATFPSGTDTTCGSGDLEVTAEGTWQIANISRFPV